MSETRYDSWHRYPKVYNLGHPAIEDLLDGHVVIQEKIDGSQFSFGRFGDHVRVRSRGREFDISAADNMFQRAAETVLRLAPLLRSGMTYRGEYLNKPKHNSLAYERCPREHIILFDVNDGHEAYLPPGELAAEAARLGLESVPVYGERTLSSPDDVAELLERESCLGGQKIEGVVVKNYARFGRDGKALMGKHVSEHFREVHSREWKKANPAGRDVVEEIAQAHRTEARWEKAAQHLREAGILLGEPKDIAGLIREVHRDIDDECAEEIKAALYKWASKRIKRNAVRGLPEWYKGRLLEAQFGTVEAGQ